MFHQNLSPDMAISRSISLPWLCHLTSGRGRMFYQKKPFLNWPSEFNVKIPLCLDIHHAWQTLCNVLTVKMSICRYGDRDLRTREGREGRVAITVGRSVIATHLTRNVTRQVTKPDRHRFLLTWLHLPSHHKTQFRILGKFESHYQKSIFCFKTSFCCSDVP